MTGSDVLVVGAGPVGLTLACELHRWGVPFRIIDRKAHPEEHTKAASFWPRTQEVTQAIGVGDLLRAQGIPIRAQTLIAFGKLIGHPALGPYPSPFNQVMDVSQGSIEHTLRDYLQAQGHAVEYNTSIAKVQQGAQGVEASIERAGGASETLHCRYLVACDGGRSAVREMVGLHIEPIPLGNTVLRQIDAKLRWSRPVTHDRIWFFLYDDGFCGVFPMPGGIYRISILGDGHGIPERHATLEEMQRDLRKLSGDPLAELGNPSWFSFGKFYYGVADRFREGRVLLAGDAGHMTIPIGGQGMNTGMQDAFNLGWKLASVLQDRTSDLVLDSYSPERHAVRRDLAADQKVNFDRLMKPTSFQKLTTLWLAPFFMRRGEQSVELGKRDESQLSIAYPHSPLSEDHLGRGGVKAGDRAPDATVVERVNLDTVRLFDLIYGKKWTLLLFDAGRAEVLHDLAALALEVGVAHPEVQAWTVRATLTTGEAHEPKGDVLLDIDRHAHEAYGVKQPTLLLVRPDGHVGFRGGLAHADALQGYTRRVFADTLLRTRGSEASEVRSTVSSR